MTTFDFYVTNQELIDGVDTITTAKQVTEGNRLPTLDHYLSVAGVDDLAIGEAIEKLEGLPNGLAQVTLEGRNGTIIVDQSW